jgi:hypothetical protein
VEPNEAEVWGFAGPIPSLDVLTQVLATIAWVASAHHAAVNFGQYDYASLVLNAATLVRRPVPRPGDAADPANQVWLRCCLRQPGACCGRTGRGQQGVKLQGQRRRCLAARA